MIPSFFNIKVSADKYLNGIATPIELYIRSLHIKSAFGRTGHFNLENILFGLEFRIQSYKSI